MRLRTLPLSLSGVVCGFFLAWADFRQGEISTLNFWVLPFLLLTTVCLQILSNMSNELGDYLSGTDGADRQGPMYSLGQGGISVQKFKRTIFFFVLLCCLFGTLMVWQSFGTLICVKAVATLLLGACAIWAAMHYTLGKNPYGYRGLGDFFVFVFFGLVSVLGSYWVMTGSLSLWPELLPASGIGLFSIGVLNVNNIRDMVSDAGTRITIPLLMGERNAKRYHTFLIVGGWACFTIYLLVSNRYHWGWWLFLLTIPLYAIHLKGVWQKSGKELDGMLPLLVMSTFALAILFGIGQL